MSTFNAGFLFLSGFHGLREFKNEDRKQEITLCLINHKSPDSSRRVWSPMQSADKEKFTLFALGKEVKFPSGSGGDMAYAPIGMQG